MRKPNMERFTGQTHQQPVVAKSMPGDRTKTCCDDRDIPHKEMFLPQLKECHTDTQELWQSESTRYSFLVHVCFHGIAFHFFQPNKFVQILKGLTLKYILAQAFWCLWDFQSQLLGNIFEATTCKPGLSYPTRNKREHFWSGTLKKGDSHWLWVISDISDF